MILEKVRQPSTRLVLVTFLLAFQGGYADAISYLSRQVFAGHLIGNLVLLMIHLAEPSLPGTRLAERSTPQMRRGEHSHDMRLPG